ncbi:flavin-containing protein [Fusarium mundagurra]|uniref:Amine oxidase n=1 Tax=Fusarium mundagurra TaxID=1567541 RepID=A0A8H5YFC8_9HYPO|nr:flavin-containing protein [Fusarium mundagurra]
MIPSPFVDVIVIGAGLSGLQAAVDLDKSGLSYIVLEANDRVGGKILSVPASPSSNGLVDLGAAWINDSNQKEMYALAQEFGFDLIVQRTEGLSLDQSNGTTHAIPHGQFGDFTDEQLAEILGIMVKLQEYVDRSNLEHPHLGPDAGRLDSMTALEFASNEFGEGIAEVLVAMLARDLLGVEADELSALFLINYIKSGTGLANISSDTKDGGQYLRNRQGNEMFAIKLAAKLDKKSIKLNSPVVKITQDKKGCTVKTKNGHKYHSSKVILSVPTCLYPKIDFEPHLPPAKKELAHSTELGYYSKSILVFDEPWWRNANLSGILTSMDGPISFTRDTCVPEDKQYSITCFHIGQLGRRWSQLPEQERKDTVMKQLNDAFGTVVGKVPEPINVIEKDWLKDPWFLGGPSPVMKPGLLTGAGKSIRDPFRNIHFIGTETSIVWKGYMEGAIRSGIRGAREVTEAIN